MRSRYAWNLPQAGDRNVLTIGAGPATSATSDLMGTSYGTFSMHAIMNNSSTQLRFGPTTPIANASSGLAVIGGTVAAPSLQTLVDPSTRYLAAYISGGSLYMQWWCRRLD